MKSDCTIVKKKLMTKPKKGVEQCVTISDGSNLKGKTKGKILNKLIYEKFKNSVYLKKFNRKITTKDLNQ